MDVEATTDGPLQTVADTVAVGVFEGEAVAHDLPGGALMALLHSGEASGTANHLAVVHAHDRRWILVGLGERGSFDGEQARVAAATVYRRAGELATRKLCWEVPHHVEAPVVAGLVEGTMLRAYQFTRYKPAAGPVSVERLLISAHHDVSAVVDRAAVLVAAQNRARDLLNTPANDLTPAALATYAESIPGVRVTVLDGQAIQAAGMGAFAAVAQGSREEARLIILEYDGPDGGDRPRLGLVGKAITFDSGGIALKPAAKMWAMKFDMGGGAAVIEAIAALAELRAPLRVLGVVGATENLPDGAAVKPGDIVRALDGTTIEVNNPDAEGRLVLADCLTYARRGGCDALVDIATLTAIEVALGTTYAGLMSNDDELAAAVERAGRATGELVWRMPLHREYAAMVKGRYAQLTNRTERRVAMPITAAEFLHHFAGDVPWAHLDIAGTVDDGHKPYFDKGGTGFGVRLLVELATAPRAD
jgi:leucyl aminopeptidase